MLGAHAFKTVWQQKNQPTQSPPFVFGTRNELIDDHQLFLRLSEHLFETISLRRRRSGRLAPTDAGDDC